MGDLLLTASKLPRCSFEKKQGIAQSLEARREMRTFLVISCRVMPSRVGALPI